MIPASLQLRQYCAARVAGQSVKQACAASGVGDGEAALWEQDWQRGEVDFTAIAAIAGANRMAEATVAADALRLFVERIERLSEERQGISDDIKDVYAEAKSTGYDTKTLREIVKLRKMEAHARQERGALLATYADALGLQLGFDL